MEELWFGIKYYLMRLAYFKKRSRLRRYGLPFVLAIGSLALIYILPDSSFRVIQSQSLSLLLLFFIVAVSSWYGGLGPGILATVLTAGVNYATLLQEDLEYHSGTADLAVTFIYLSVGFLISVISEARYEAELEREEFLGLISHELKNPLATVKGYTGLLRKRAKGWTDPKNIRFIEEIELQTDRILELINDLLDINKIEIGKFTYRHDLFDFDIMVNEIVGHHRIISPDRKIVLSGKSGHVVFADRYRIAQVLSNLITNAIKYSPANTTVRVEIKKEKNKALLFVRDRGLGILPGDKNKIFNQHYRTRKTLRGQTEGLGLGLFISKSIVNAYKGSIGVLPEDKKGSTFYFKLPTAK